MDQDQYYARLAAAEGRAQRLRTNPAPTVPRYDIQSPSISINTVLFVSTCGDALDSFLNNETHTIEFNSVAATTPTNAFYQDGNFQQSGLGQIGIPNYYTIAFGGGFTSEIGQTLSFDNIKIGTTRNGIEFRGPIDFSSGSLSSHFDRFYDPHNQLSIVSGKMVFTSQFDSTGGNDPANWAYGLFDISTYSDLWITFDISWSNADPSNQSPDLLFISPVVNDDPSDGFVAGVHFVIGLP